MTRPTAFLVLGLALASCEDATGLGSTCAAEMADVRRAEGSPDRKNSSRDGSDFYEQWIYDPGQNAGRVYAFRWGLSYESCEVSGPSALDIVAL